MAAARATPEAGGGSRKSSGGSIGRPGHSDDMARAMREIDPGWWFQLVAGGPRPGWLNHLSRNPWER